jgi:hypothetical protein
MNIHDDQIAIVAINFAVVAGENMNGVRPFYARRAGRRVERCAADRLDPS